jgi:hypothetical protein
MQVSGVSIEATNRPGWYRLTFTSMKSFVGETKLELLCNADTLRRIQHESGKALGEKPDYSNLPDNLRKFMEDES